MDNEPTFEPELTSESATDADGPPPTPVTSAFFSKSGHFVVTGGSFTNINQQPVSPDRPDFLFIPLGDLKLVDKIGPYGVSDLVRCWTGRASVRRVYSVKIHGSDSRMTAAVYQGNGAEEQWQEDFSRYSDLRHPHLLQLYGVVQTRGLHAAVFHDDLVSWIEWGIGHYDSPLSNVVFWATITSQYQDAQEYFRSVTGRDLCWAMYTVWIRPSTGRLCVDLTPPECYGLGVVFLDSGVPSSGGSLLDSLKQSDIMSSISLHDYHNICRRHLCQSRPLSISADIPIKIGSIRRFPGADYESSIEIAFLPDCRIWDEGWGTENPDIANHWKVINDRKEGAFILESGWTRVNSANVMAGYLGERGTREISSMAWLVQAHHIFNSLNITFNFENYEFIDKIRCMVRLLGSLDNLPPGYLFLCPLAEFATGVPTYCQLPKWPAYWSRDPWGVERLSPAEAKSSGFPDIQLQTEVVRLTWDSSVYEGIRQVTRAKGFDPCSQDVARELGYPLVQASSEPHTLFMHDEHLTNYQDRGTKPRKSPLMRLKSASVGIRKLFRATKKWIHSIPATCRQTLQRQY